MRLGAHFKKAKSFIRRHPKRMFLCASALATTLTYLVPGTVSDPFETYLKDEGIPVEVTKYFSSAETRVYSRHNPLYPFHVGITSLKANYTNPDQFAIEKALNTPTILYNSAKDFGYAMLLVLPLLSVDAFSIHSGNEYQDLKCFIRPPGNLTIGKAIGEFTGISVKGINLKFRSDPGTLSKLFKEYVVLHERRHCDQEDTALIAHESDADLYALNVLREAYPEKRAAVDEVATIIGHLRTFNAVKGRDIEHMSTPTLERGSQTFIETERDRATYISLNRILKSVVTHNKTVISDYGFHLQDNGYLDLYFAAKAVVKKSPSIIGPAEFRAAQKYIEALQYIDGLLGGSLLQQKYLSVELNADFLDQKYMPVPGRLEIKAPLGP